MATQRENGISWCDYTFNPWSGCTKVSAGCANCYAESTIKRFYGNGFWGNDSIRKPMSEKYWESPYGWNSRKSDKNFVFCASMADVFEDRNDVVQYRSRLFDLIKETQNLTWLVLTKRPENINRMIPLSWVTQQTPKNVIIGTTIENQDVLSERVSALKDTPFSRRFYSCEPLLGNVNFNGSISSGDWVICGGESGHSARPMHISWVYYLRDQCRSSGTIFHFKQWGEWIHEKSCGDIDTSKCHTYQWKDGSFSFKVGKKNAGHLLDGVEFRDRPLA